MEVNFCVTGLIAWLLPINLWSDSSNFFLATEGQERERRAIPRAKWRQERYETEGDGCWLRQDLAIKST